MKKRTIYLEASDRKHDPRMPKKKMGILVPKKETLSSFLFTPSNWTDTFPGSERKSSTPK